MTTGNAMQKNGRLSVAGFTLIELVVVISIIGLLLSLAAPRYFASIERGKESVQQQNIYSLRDAIDKFFGDNGRYPETLEELVSKRYLRAMPVDPFTQQTDWIAVPPPDETMTGVYDIKSAMNKEEDRDVGKKSP